MDTFDVCFWPVRNVNTSIPQFLILKALTEYTFSLKRILKNLKVISKTQFLKTFQNSVSSYIQSSRQMLFTELNTFQTVYLLSV